MIKLFKKYIPKIFVGFLVLFVVLFFTCRERKIDLKYSEYVVTSQHLTSLAITHDIEGARYTYYADSNYSIPSEEWVEKVFIQGFFEFQKKNDLWIYRKEKNDCDDFANWAKSVAVDLGRKSGYNYPVSAATFVYRPHLSNFNHAINAFIVGDTNKIRAIFFEPQLMKIINLSKPEIDSRVYSSF